MKVLLDEDLPVQLAASLRSDHETAHVAQIVHADLLQDLQALVPELLEVIATAPRRAVIVIPGTEGRAGRGVPSF